MLTNCPDCNKQVSKNAQTCPHCGNPLKSENEILSKQAGEGLKLLAIGTGIFLAGLAIYIFFFA